ncbi:MAG TPA: CheR family methyltransferase, partial [Geobacteraceae bacterium]|nr:CheR family methyltransferase [Geobacteraceae bacterium]
FEQTKTDLSALVTGGVLRNRKLNSRIARLDERFTSYLAYYPFGLWAPGLFINTEMSSLTEQYLPLAEIKAAFRQFFSIALRFPPSEESSPLRSISSWLDLLQRFRLTKATINPAAFLRKLTDNETLRIRFLFTALVPHHHGGSFARYPSQAEFLETWLSRKRDFHARNIRCLDTACGTGESTYDLAGLLARRGTPSRHFEIHGCSLEPLEVFSAAHCCFPHDSERENQFRTVVEPLFSKHATNGMRFFRDDVMRFPEADEIPYDIILCNGLLGGPFLHEKEMVANALASLTKRLAPGGVLLTADRFHDGWKKICPPKLIGEIMQRHGLTVRILEEGLVAEKP